MGTAGAPHVRLLVADDSDVNRLIMRQFLEEAGHAVDEAADGDEALRRFRAGRYEVVFLDMRMPVLDGIAAAGAMRAWEAAHGRTPTPIVLVTVGAGAADRAAALAAGCQAVLRRPVGPAVLTAAVEVLTAGGRPPDLTAATARMQPAAPDARLAHLVPRLLARLAEESTAMAAAAAARDWPAVADLAHKGRGECAVFGIFSLEGSLEELEAAATRGDAAAVRRLLGHHRALLRWHGQAGGA